jgi:hypothetical protein
MFCKLLLKMNSVKGIYFRGKKRDEISFCICLVNIFINYLNFFGYNFHFPFVFFYFFGVLWKERRRRRMKEIVDRYNDSLFLSVSFLILPIRMALTLHGSFDFLALTRSTQATLHEHSSFNIFLRCNFYKPWKTLKPSTVQFKKNRERDKKVGSLKKKKKNTSY